MRKARILHIIDNLSRGGTEKQCVELVKNINKEKYYVEVLAFDKNGVFYEDLVNAGIPLTEIRLRGSFYSPPSLFKIIQLALFIRKRRFDIVQTYGFYSTIPGVIAAKIAGVRMVISGKRDMHQLLPALKLKTEEFLWRFCAKIVVNARAIRDYLVAKRGVPEKKIKVIYNGVDFKKYKPIPKKDYYSRADIVGMVADFREEKDHRTFLEAASLVLKQKSAVTFFLVGEGGSLENEIKRYVGHLGIKGSVIFCGAKTGRELYDVLGSFSISVLSSVSEGMSNVILESMVFGTPVIATFSGGNPEVVEDGVTGYLFPHKRADILAEKIIYLLENKNIAMEMGKKGEEKVEREFSNGLMVSRFEELYDSLLAKK